MDRIPNLNEEIKLFFESDRFRNEIRRRATTIDPAEARRIGRAYAMNPNVNPQVVAAIALGGGDQNVLGQISEVAAQQQVRDGYGAPYNIGRPYGQPNGPVGASASSAFALMQENNIAKVAEQVDRQGEEGGDDGLFGWLHGALKGTVRGAMVISESGWQATEAFIRGVTDFDGETDLGLGDVFRNTSLYEAFRQQFQEGGADLGSGYFVGGEVQARQAQRQQELLGTVTLPSGETKTWNAGLGFAQSLAQTKLIPYNDAAYQIASGIYSAVGAITFDPLNALGIGIAQRGATSVDNLSRLGSRTARKVNRSIELAREAEKSGDFVTALKYNEDALYSLGIDDFGGGLTGARDRLSDLSESRIAVESFLRDEAGFVSAGGERSLIIPEFVRSLTKDRSIRAMQYMADETDTAKIWRLHKGKIGATVIEELAQAKSIDEVIRTYAYALGNPAESSQWMLGYLPEMGMMNLPEKGLMVRNIIAPYTRWFNYLPDSSILDPRDGNSYVNRVDSLYSTLPTAASFRSTAGGRVKIAMSDDSARRFQRYDIERRDEMLRRSIKAFASGDDTAIKQLNSEMAEDFKNMFMRMGWSAEEASALTRWAADRDRLGQFSIADLQNPVDVSEAPLMASQLLQSGATVIDPRKLKEVLRGSGRVQQMRRLNTKYHKLSDENWDLVSKIQELEGALLLDAATDAQKVRWADELNDLKRQQNNVQRQVDELAERGDPISKGFIQGAIIRGDHFMSQWWKPLTLVRAAYILRIVPEEIARVTVGGVFGVGPGAFMDFILATMGDIDKFGRVGRYEVDALGNQFSRKGREAQELAFRQTDLLDELATARKIGDETEVARLQEQLNIVQSQLDAADEQAYELFEQAMISRRRGESLATVTRDVSGASLTDRRLMANMSGGKSLASKSITAQREKWVEGLTDYYFQAANDIHLNRIARVASGGSLPKTDRFAINGVVGNWDEHVAAGRIRDVREGLIFWMQGGTGREALDDLIRSYAAEGRVLDPDNLGDVGFILDKQVEHLATLVGGKPANAGFSPSALGDNLPSSSPYVYRQLTSADPVPSVFHGTSRSFDEGRLAQDSMFERQASGNLVGPGFYTTDSPDIAKSYQRKGAGGAPNVYEARWVGDNPPRIFDLNEPLASNPETQTFLREWVASNSEFIDSAEELWQELIDAVENGNGVDFYRLLYKNFADAGIRRTDADEIVMDLNAVLSDTFDAMLHEGGVQGGAKHNVYVWINEGNIEVTKAAVAEVAPVAEVPTQLYNVIDGGEIDLLQAIGSKRFDGANLKLLDSKGADVKINSGFRDRLKTFAESSNAPERVLYNNNMINGEERFSFLNERIVAPFFTKFYGLPSDKLSRSPAFRRYYWLQMEQLVRSADDAAAVRLVANAERAGLPRNLLDRIVEASKARVVAPGEGANLKALDEVAKGAALARVQDLLYDASRRGAAMDQLRLITPFGDAWKEVWSMWTKEIVRQRGMPVKRLAKGIQGMRDANVMQEDPITGDWHIQVPFSDRLARLALTQGPTDATMGDFPVAPFTMPAQSLNVLGTFSPGVGPVMNVGINSLLPDDPSWDSVRDWLFPVAEPALPETEAGRNNLWQQLVFPSPWMRRAAAALPDSGPLRYLRNFVNDLETDPAFQATRNHVVQSLASARPASETMGANNQKKLFDDANEIAKRMYFMRGVFAFIGPGAPMPRYIAETGQGNMPAALLTDEWRKLEQELLSSGQNPGLAAQMMVDIYGPQIWLYTASNSESQVKGAQSSDAWWDWYRSGGDRVVENYPLMGAYFGETGDFSIDAYGSLFARGIYERKTGQALYDEAATDIAFLAYNRLRDQFPPEAQRTPEQRRLLASARTGLEEYWGVSLSGAVRIAERENQINEIKRLLTAGDAGDSLARSMLSSDAGQLLMQYMAMRDVFAQQTMDLLGGVSDTSFRQLRAAAPFRDSLRELGTRLSAQNEAFARIYQYVLDGELFDDEDQADLAAQPMRSQSVARVRPGEAGRRSMIPRISTSAGV
jgi:hypothetical protein